MAERRGGDSLHPHGRDVPRLHQRAVDQLGPLPGEGLAESAQRGGEEQEGSGGERGVREVSGVHAAHQVSGGRRGVGAVRVADG